MRLYAGIESRAPLSIRPAFPLSHWLLEVVFQAKLNQTSRHCRLGDPGKSCRCGDVDHRWEPKHWMVPQVEEFRSELKCVALRDREPLCYGEVPVLLERTAKSVSRNVAVSRSSSASRERNVHRSSKAGGIQITVKPAPDRASRVKLAVRRARST